MINKEIKGTDGRTYFYEITSDDNYVVNIDKNYKLIKFIKPKKTFKDTLLGSDIGINSHGFISVATIATFIAVLAFVSLILSCRI